MLNIKRIYSQHDVWFSGILIGPQVSKLMKNDQFAATLNAVEKRPFDAINDVIDNFLGNRKAENYREIVGELIQLFREMNVNMSLKIHFLHNHLDFFRTISETSATNTAKDFIKMWRLSKNDLKVKILVTCLVNTVGLFAVKQIQIRWNVKANANTFQRYKFLFCHLISDDEHKNLT